MDNRIIADAVFLHRAIERGDYANDPNRQLQARMMVMKLSTSMTHGEWLEFRKQVDGYVPGEVKRDDAQG